MCVCACVCVFVCVFVCVCVYVCVCSGADKLDIQEVVKVAVERLNAKYNNMYLYTSLNNGYRRFDPQRGMEYILDIMLRDTSSGNREVPKRVQLVRPLGQVSVGSLQCNGVTCGSGQCWATVV